MLNRCPSIPRSNPEDRVYTVISGVFYIGLGDEFDADKLEAYPPGEYITQVSAIGMLGMEYVNSRDDPRE